MQTRTQRRSPQRPPPEAERVPNISVVIAGGWLAVTPLLLDHHTAGVAFAAWNDVLVGGTLAIFATIRILRPRGTSALSLVNVLLGLWLLAAPFVSGYHAATLATLSALIVGLVVIMLAGVDWLAAREAQRHPDQRTR
ncbi:SPW repeat protein [Actinoplanes sp. GCM10030250]|uniref:SPW repeat protein n=1 Tax=Actinoplanes sp. GCM10030250 TaxID=3273376 RepID=UPI003609D2A6